MTVSSTMPPVPGCRRVERVDCCTGRDESEVGVMLSRKASAPGPEKWCWTLNCQLTIDTTRCLNCLHVPDVKQTRIITRPVVRVDDAQVAVLHGHRIAAKRHKLGAVLGVKLIQSRPGHLLLPCLSRGISDLLVLLVLLLGELAGLRLT
jgi:hypothetical protein